MKKILFAVTMLFTATTTQAEDTIHVLRGAPAGGGAALWANAIVDTLRENGYNTRLVALRDCKQVTDWVRSNPDTPYALMTYSDYAILDEIKPGHPAACGYQVNEDNLVTIAGRYWHFLCGKKDINDSVDYLRNTEGLKVGVWNHPVGYTVSDVQVQHLGSSAKTIGFASGKQMMTAFNTGDIDYIVLSSENLVGSLKNPSCFLTAASTENANKHMQDRVSYDTVQGTPFINYGLWPMIAADNLDIEEMRKIFKDSPSKSYTDLTKFLIEETKPVNEQLIDLQQTAQGLRGLVQ